MPVCPSGAPGPPGHPGQEGARGPKGSAGKMQITLYYTVKCLRSV